MDLILPKYLIRVHNKLTVHLILFLYKTVRLKYLRIIFIRIRNTLQCSSLNVTQRNFGDINY